MNNRVRTVGPRWEACTHAIVVLVLVAATWSPAQAEVSDSARFASLTGQLKNAHYARIGIDGRTFILVEPRVEPDGLMFDRVEGFPINRPAIITGAGWDSIAPVPNPVPWSSLQRIEAGNRTRRPGALTGGVVGLAGGLLVGGFYGAMYEMGGEGEGWHFALGVTALSTVLGMGVGALFPTTTWTPVHHAPEVTR